MYLSGIEVKGFRVFGETFRIELNDGLTVIVGENGCGKSAIIDAIRLLLVEDEYGRIGTSPSDFHRGKNDGDQPAEELSVFATFSNLSGDEQAAFLPWLDAQECSQCRLSVRIRNQENPRGGRSKTYWGGDASLSVFEWELINSIACIYLPPLRDAETKLESYRGSRFSRLFRRFKPGPGDPKHDLETQLADLNDSLLANADIREVNEHIKKYVRSSLGPLLSQGTAIQFSEIEFDRIVERLRLLFHPSPYSPEIKDFRKISENSLGYNNLLYLASVLAELEFLESSQTLHKVLLIEEPEAHLHPQLQSKLLQFLQEQATSAGIQIIITTHSPTITAAVSLDSLNVITAVGEGYKSTLVRSCKPSEEHKFFLERWLDITKSTLFFAKGLIFVEGIAEGLVIKELAKRIIEKELDGVENAPTSLEDFGVSIICLNGIYFRHFFSLFSGFRIIPGAVDIVESIPLKCAGITDCDPEPVEETRPTSTSPCGCDNDHSKNLSDELLAHSTTCRVFHNLKTFEYDLGLCGNNLSVLYRILHSTYKTNTVGARRADRRSRINWSNQREARKALFSWDILKSIKKEKGTFAQRLAAKLSTDKKLEFETPHYIYDAIMWVLADPLEQVKANDKANRTSSP